MDAGDERAPSAPATDAAGAAAIPVLLALGHALHRFGAPAHRLEEAMTRVCLRLGLEGQFFAMPTAIIASFGPPGAQSTTLLRCESDEVHLDKLARLDRLSEDLERGRLGLEGAARELDRIVQAPTRYRRTLAIASHGLVAAGAARILGGGLAEVLVASVLGVLTGALSLALTRVPAGARLFEPLAAFIATVLTRLVGSALHPVSPHVAILAGIIVLIPGLTLTVGMTELATRHLVSGTSRLTAAVIVFLQIIFGVALGGRVSDGLFGPAQAVTMTALPPWTEGLALVLVFPGLLVLFRAPLGAWWAVLLVEHVAYLGARAGTAALGPELGIAVGAFLVGVAGNVYNRWRRQPAAVLMMPGLLLLVPGSMGFKSLSLLLEDDPVSALAKGFSMLLGAVSIVAGLLLANVAVSPRRPI